MVGVECIGSDFWLGRIVFQHEVNNYTHIENQLRLTIRVGLRCATGEGFFLGGGSYTPLSR